VTTFGIDVSIWQGTGINWAQVAQSGIKFAIARASIGRTIDGSFKANLKGMKEAGILSGAYHYLYHGNGAGQARTYLSQIGSPEGILCVLDVEYKEVVYDDVKAFAEEFKAATGGHDLIIYTGGWFWRSTRFGNPPGALLGPLWHSRYVFVAGRDPRNKEDLYSKVQPAWWTPGYGGWPQATLLQFTSMGSVPGIPGRVDINAYRGEWGDLVNLAHKATIPDTSTEAPMPYAIAAGGLTLDSDYRIDLKAGTPLYLNERDVLTKLSANASVKYFGQPRDGSPFYVVLVNTGALYPDKESRPTLVLVKRTDAAAPYRLPTGTESLEKTILELEEEIDGLESKIEQAKAALA